MAQLASCIPSLSFLIKFIHIFKPTNSHTTLHIYVYSNEAAVDTSLYGSNTEALWTKWNGRWRLCKVENESKM